MAQPVRKSIIESHPKLDGQPIYTLIVDGTNLMKIAMIDPKINNEGIHYGGVFQFLLQLKILLQKKDFDYVYVFFDDEDSGILRYEIYNDYKANRDKNYAQHSDGLSDYMKSFNANLKAMQQAIYGKKTKKYKDSETLDKERVEKENFIREREILMKYFNELYIRWMFDDKTEGDDLIAYYVLNKKPNDRVVIVSADEDLTQLLSDTVCIYNPRLKKFVSNKNFKEIRGYIHENVVIKKILCGDTSDNIGNIDGVSEKRLFDLIPEIKERPITINEIKERAQQEIEERKKNKKKPLKWHENIVNGVSKRNYNGDFYEINNKIINLSTPLLTDDAREELESMMYTPMDPDGRSFNNLYQYIVEDNIADLLNSDRFSTFFSTFKSLIDKENKRYKDFLDKKS